MTTLYLLCGLPGAGKTSLAKRLERERRALRLTPDDWLTSLFGRDREPADTHRATVEALQWLVAERALTLGVDVVLDFGFWSRSERDDFRARAEARGARTEVHFVDAPRDELWARIAARNADLPADAYHVGEAELDEFVRMFEAPEPDELEPEGQAHRSGVRGLVSHIDLNVSDPRRSIPFYALVLERIGFRRGWVEPQGGRDDLGAVEPTDRCGWWLLYRGGALFNIEVRPPAHPAPRDRHERYSPGLDHLAFHAANRAEVDALYEALRSEGIHVADPPREYDYSPGYYAVAFDDPDGVRLEVVHDPTANP